MITQGEQIHALTETLIYELVKAFALPRSQLADKLIRLIFGRTAHRHMYETRSTDLQ